MGSTSMSVLQNLREFRYDLVPGRRIGGHGCRQTTESSVNVEREQDELTVQGVPRAVIMDRERRATPARIRGFLHIRLVDQGTILPGAEQIRSERIVVITGWRGAAPLLAPHCQLP